MLSTCLVPLKDNELLSSENKTKNFLNHYDVEHYSLPLVYTHVAAGAAPPVAHVGAHFRELITTKKWGLLWFKMVWHTKAHTKRCLRKVFDPPILTATYKHTLSEQEQGWNIFNSLLMR